MRESGRKQERVRGSGREQARPLRPLSSLLFEDKRPVDESNGVKEGEGGQKGGDDPTRTFADETVKAATQWPAGSKGRRWGGGVVRKGTSKLVCLPISPANWMFANG